VAVRAREARIVLEIAVRRALRRKAVAATPYSLDQIILAGGFQRFSEPAYVHIYRALLDESLRTHT